MAEMQPTRFPFNQNSHPDIKANPQFKFNEKTIIRSPHLSIIIHGDRLILEFRFALMVSYSYPTSIEVHENIIAQ